jgi:uncharacterized protein (TIGR02147 family)
MMMTRDRNYRQILREELESRCEQNSRYSLRAFARDLGITSSRLSEVLGGRYGLSREAAQKIAKQLGWNEIEISIFCDLVEAEHARAKKKKAEAKSRLASNTREYQQLTLDSFQVISDWYHFAILELTMVIDFDSDPKWIARRLGISDHVAVAAIDRLKRLDLLTEEKGVLHATDGFTASPSGVPSDALKKFHRQLLEKALSSIYLQNVDERDLSHMIMAIDHNQVSEAKEEIKKFRRRFDDRFGKAAKKDDVYCLGVTFFRLQEKTI